MALLRPPGQALARSARAYCRFLPSLAPPICVEGPRAVGKTATANPFAKSVIALDDAAELELLRASPARLPAPVLEDLARRA